MSAPEANTPALRTLALWDLAEPMARLLLEMDPEGSNGCCQSCHSEMPIMVGRSVRHRPDCPWSPGGLIERIRALVPRDNDEGR